MSESARKHAWMGPAALIVAVFVAGVLAGAAGMRLLDRDGRPFEGRPPAPRVGERGGFPGGRPAGPENFFLEQISERLDLDEAQRAQVDSIIRAQRQKSREVMEALRPRLSASLDSMNQAIAEVLEPGQMDGWETLLEEFQERIDRERGERGDRDGRRGRRGPPGF